MSIALDGGLKCEPLSDAIESVLAKVLPDSSGGATSHVVNRPGHRQPQPCCSPSSEQAMSVHRTRRPVLKDIVFTLIMALSFRTARKLWMGKPIFVQ